MAKSVGIAEEPTIAAAGKWYWKEDTSTLEFQPSAVQPVDPKEKKNQRKKNVAFGEVGSKKDRATPNRFDGKGQGKGPQAGGIGARSARSNKADKETTVTLQRVKSVVLFMLNEVNFPTESFEMCLYELEQFDEFLLGLLNYFASFFDKLALEKKPKQMTTEPSFAEREAMAEIQQRMEVAQRHLGHSYCILILGLGLQSHHHMGSGSKRQSSTYKDREIYETLYKFCVHLVWLVFRRKDHDLINKELGRMLRSDIFNPALRVKNAPEEEENDNDEELSRDMFSFTSLITPAERRRQQKSRPAITSIVKTKSPVLVSLLPTPKEASGWLFNKLTLDASGQSQLPEELSQNRGKPSFFKKNIGIIGEPLNQFNPQTLAPVGSDQDEETEEDSQAKRETTFAGTPTKTTPMQAGMSRQLTSMSQATDVFSDEDDE